MLPGAPMLSPAPTLKNWHRSSPMYIRPGPSLISVLLEVAARRSALVAIAQPAAQDFARLAARNLVDESDAARSLDRRESFATVIENGRDQGLVLRGMGAAVRRFYFKQDGDQPSDDVQLQITRPDGSVLNEVDFLSGEVQIISELSDSSTRVIGIAPGANIGDTIALFEATHGTAPKYAGQDKVNPGSLILSAEMMLRYMGWREAADLIIKGTEGAIANGTVTYDFERLMTGATLLKCSEFGAAMVEAMD